MVREKRNSISHKLLKELVDVPIFNYEICPICDQNLLDRSSIEFIDRQCKNGCYHFSKLGTTRSNEIYFPWSVYVFDRGFDFITKISISSDGRHYNYDYSHFIMVNKRVKNLIKYYKTNERYLMRFLTEVR